MTKLAFVMSGPQGGQVVEMDEQDLEDAINDGWAKDFAVANMGGEPDPFAGHNTQPHAKAEAWLAKKQGYATRELRAGDPGTPTPAEKPEAAKPVADIKESATDAETPAKGKTARPKK